MDQTLELIATHKAVTERTSTSTGVTTLKAKRVTRQQPPSARNARVQRSGAILMGHKLFPTADSA